MNVVGTVDSLWRYPIKSMAGEALPEAFVGYAGVYGDRIYALLNSAGHGGFPYLTGRDRPEMLRYRPRFRNPAVASKPPNLADALQLAELSPVYPSLAELEVDVDTPSGQTLAVDDPALLAMLAEERSSASLSLLRSHRTMTDCRPVSLISLETIEQLGLEVNAPLDKRRFRANIYAQLGTAKGFGEDALVGRRLQIGSRAVIAVLEQDARCKMITIDPDTGRRLRRSCGMSLAPTAATPVSIARVDGRARTPWRSDRRAGLNSKRHPWLFLEGLATAADEWNFCALSCVCSRYLCSHISSRGNDQ